MENKIENNAMFKLTYGLFVLSVNDGVKDNGCIVNTVSMLTENPKRITVYVNKLNYTEQMIRKSGVFNVSVLTESAPFDIFKQFGFSSGRDVYKFAGKTYPRTSNGLYYLPGDFREGDGYSRLRYAYALCGGSDGGESAFSGAFRDVRILFRPYQTQARRSAQGCGNGR